MNNPYVCPTEFAGTLDNLFRKFFHDPHKILSPYINKGMSVLDLGCGPGYFTSEMVRLAGEQGIITAADLQQGMLDKMMKKLKANNLENRVRQHLCRNDSIGISYKVDFVLAFWMVHEVPDQKRLFEELYHLLNQDGRVLIVEPKIHVSARSFEEMLGKLESAGLKITHQPVISLSRAVLSVKSS